MKINHTSGRWRAGTSGGTVVTDAELATETDRSTGHGHVEHYGGLLIAESIARRDIAVISAAPDLLEALQSIENDDGSIPSSIWAMRNAAIAKARGEQS